MNGSGAFSPDGKWIAYNSFGGQVSRSLIFVEPHPAFAHQVAVAAATWTAQPGEFLYGPAPTQHYSPN